MSPSKTTAAWQTALNQVITDPVELLTHLDLDKTLLQPHVIKVIKQFPLRVPRSFVARMQKGNPYDPLLRQVLPLDIELEPAKNFSSDPLKEKKVNPVPGLLHKYHGRVLLTLTGTCGINCRYCFRRHFPYEENNPGMAGWAQAFDYIKNDPSVNEVILSGGDPLLLPDRYLEKIVEKIVEIPHVKTLRIHSRLPIVLPERMTSSFITWVTQSSLKPVLVIHCNHAQEIDHTVREAMQTLRKAGITLLNQSVLLKGVNDSAEILIALSEALFSIGVLPYYLHALDKVQGAAHFEVAANNAQSIYEAMRKRLPGYLLPRFVCEIPGAESKSTMLF